MSAQRLIAVLALCCAIDLATPVTIGWRAARVAFAGDRAAPSDRSSEDH
jgi:hypothetical protein